MNIFRRGVSGAFPLLVVFGLALHAALGPQAQESQRQPSIKVETNLVTLLASVLDSAGRPVLDLPRNSFQLSENGAQQKIERFEAETSQPLDLALMVDSSLSTLKDLKFEREAAAHFIRQVVRPGDRLAVFQFADEVTQLSDFSANVPELQAAARGIAPGAGTSMYDAIVLGSQALARGPGERRRVIVLLTDAGETTSSSPFEQARRAAIASQALLYSIVVQTIKSENVRNTAGEHALDAITDVTGGAMYYLQDLGELDAMFDRIDRELRTQYRLGYYPSPAPAPGTYRRIELRVAGGYSLHYRKGYFAPGSAP